MPFQASTEQQIIWEPQPGPQTALLECPVFEVFYGGARGGGKTEGSIGDWLQHSNEYGEHAIGIFFRRALTQLAEVIARTQQIFPKLGAKWNEQKKTWTMQNGARLKFAYLERDSDAEEYQGHSYTRVYVEELTNFPSASPINKLRATLRSGAGVPTGMRLTGNPGGPGHHWVKARYIDPAPMGFKLLVDSMEITVDGVKKTVALERVFIPSKISDNMLLMRNDPTYILRLSQSGSAALVKAWLEGDWNVVDGAYFDDWSEANILRTEDWFGRIPVGAQKFRSFDWGSAKPFSVGWYAISDGTWGLPKDALVKFREWYGAKGPNIGLKMTADLVALGIIAREREMGIRCEYGIADPAIYIRNGGPSIAETMAITSSGVSWRPADNKRIPGWEKMRMYLVGRGGHMEKDKIIGSTPDLYFLDSCIDSIRTIPVLQHDESNPEDLDSDEEDHAADETRYACMSRPWLARPAKAEGTGLPKLPGQHTINELVSQLRRKRIAASQ